MANTLTCEFQTHFVISLPNYPQINIHTHKYTHTHTENVHIFDDDKQDPVKAPSLLPLAIEKGTKLRN